VVFIATPDPATALGPGRSHGRGSRVVTSSGLVHDALFYEDESEYVAGIRELGHAALAAGEPLLIAVPGRKVDILRAVFADAGDRVEFADMSEAGRNPARILPVIRSFIDSHADRPVRLVGEPIWAGRAPSEIVEAVRHEALINAAFADTAAHIVCPYDAGALGPGVLDDARRTHPTLVCCGEHQPSSGYEDPLVVYAAADRPLAEPEAPAVQLSLARGLAELRRIAERWALEAGLESDRAAAFVLAANEAAANTLRHAGGNGVARLWQGDRALVCELSDKGRIDDPFVGRRVPPAAEEGGRGLWLINQLCDLVELRSGAGGTVVRLHMETV